MLNLSLEVWPPRGWPYSLSSDLQAQESTTVTATASESLAISRLPSLQVVDKSLMRAGGGAATAAGA